jgi:myxalamid-type polyketide synthase MxaC
MAATAAIEDMQRKGVRVQVMALDVSDAEAVVDLLEHRISPPVRGIVYAAGVLDDALLGELDAERLRAVMRPKVNGAWNLHRATLGRPLDFFILFSSVASVLGSPSHPAPLPQPQRGPRCARLPAPCTWPRSCERPVGTLA